MQQAKNCNNCKHFHADPEQEGVFGDCRKNAPVPMPQDIAGSQPGYSCVIYMGTWPAVFGDDLCSQHQNRATEAANTTADTEAPRDRNDAYGDARSTPVYEAATSANTMIVDGYECLKYGNTYFKIDDIKKMAVAAMGHYDIKDMIKGAVKEAVSKMEATQ